MKAYGEVDVQTNVFLTSALVGGVCEFPNKQQLFHKQH
jgi:hypothetical protein